MEIAPDFSKRTGYRLPTEAEWEFSCRAGAITPWNCGHAEKLVRHYAWLADNCKASQPVGTRKPNDLGCFDMHGNAWEWCQDPFEMKISKLVLDQDARVLRGGSFPSGPKGLMEAYFRFPNAPASPGGEVWFSSGANNSHLAGERRKTCSTGRKASRQTPAGCSQGASIPTWGAVVLGNYKRRRKAVYELVRRGKPYMD